MTARRPHVYDCPTCPRTVTAAAGHHARQRTPCLACLRARNGWQHQPGCTAEPDHRGPCEVQR